MFSAIIKQMFSKKSQALIPQCYFCQQTLQKVKFRDMIIFVTHVE